MDASNPLLTEWRTPFGLPPFSAIEPDHYRRAFEVALREHEAEIAAIADNPALATFENTIDALELAGQTLTRVGGVFWNLVREQFHRRFARDRTRHFACSRATFRRHFPQ